MTRCHASPQVLFYYEDGTPCRVMAFPAGTFTDRNRESDKHFPASPVFEIDKYLKEFFEIVKEANNSILAAIKSITLKNLLINIPLFILAAILGILIGDIFTLLVIGYILLNVFLAKSIFLLPLICQLLISSSLIAILVNVRSRDPFDHLKSITVSQAIVLMLYLSYVIYST